VQSKLRGAGHAHWQNADMRFEASVGIAALAESPRIHGGIAALAPSYSNKRVSSRTEVATE